MKKIFIITILVALILATFSSIVFAGNPPGLIVRDDGQAQEHPWQEMDSYINYRDNISEIQLSTSDNLLMDNKISSSFGIADKVVLFFCKYIFISRMINYTDCYEAISDQ